MAADSEIKITRKQGLQFRIMQYRILPANIAAHRLNREQPRHIAIE